MSTVTIGLVMLSLALAVAFLIHGLVTGVGIPYPDPTAAQAAYEALHRPISTGLFLTTGVLVVACLVTGLIWGCIGLVTWLRRS